MKYSIITILLALLLVLTACGGQSGSSNMDFPLPEPQYTAKVTRDFATLESALADFTPARAADLDALLPGKTVLDIQDLMQAGQLTSEELVTYYVDRIQRYDVDKLNSVMALNPQALESPCRAGTTKTASLSGSPWSELTWASQS